MIANKRKFTLGLVLLIAFAVVFVLLLLPLFDGKNALDALDDLYNSISKGSAYYVGDLRNKAEKHLGEDVALRLTYEDAERAGQATSLFERGGAVVESEGESIKVKGDFGKILGACLEDADDLFENDGEAVTKRYDYDERQALYTWWLSLGEMDKDLKRQESFKQATFVGKVRTKAVECAYNYYGVVPEKISNKIPIVLFSLIFYVVYTIWYGFAILFLFEGWGLRLGH